MAHEQRLNVLKKIWHRTLKQNKPVPSSPNTHTRPRTPTHTLLTCSSCVNMHICGYNRIKHSLKKQSQKQPESILRKRNQSKTKKQMEAMFNWTEGRKYQRPRFVFSFPERRSQWCCRRGKRARGQKGVMGVNRDKRWLTGDSKQGLMRDDCF